MTEVLEMTLIRQIEAVPGEDSPLVPTVLNHETLTPTRWKGTGD